MHEAADQTGSRPRIGSPAPVPNTARPAALRAFFERIDPASAEARVARLLAARARGPIRSEAGAWAVIGGTVEEVVLGGLVVGRKAWVDQ